MMGLATLPAITATLISEGLDPTTPAVTVADAGLPSQRVVRGDAGRHRRPDPRRRRQAAGHHRDRRRRRLQRRAELAAAASARRCGTAAPGRQGLTSIRKITSGGAPRACDDQAPGHQRRDSSSLRPAGHGCSSSQRPTPAIMAASDSPPCGAAYGSRSQAASAVGLGLARPRPDSGPVQRPKSGPAGTPSGDGRRSTAARIGGSGGDHQPLGHHCPCPSGPSCRLMVRPDQPGHEQRDVTQSGQLLDHHHRAGVGGDRRDVGQTRCWTDW